MRAGKRKRNGSGIISISAGSCDRFASRFPIGVSSGRAFNGESQNAETRLMAQIHISNHALRRYLERAKGFVSAKEDDAAAIDQLRSRGVDIGAAVAEIQQITQVSRAPEFDPSSAAISGF